MIRLTLTLLVFGGAATAMAGEASADRAAKMLNEVRQEFRSGEYRDAKKEIDKLLRYAPKSAEVHRLNGSILVKLNRLPEALAAYEKALSLDPKDAEAKYNVAWVLDQLGQYDAAIKAYSEARQDAATLNARGFLYYRRGGAEKRPQARKDFEEALKHDPKHAGAHVNLGVMDLEDKLYASAIAHFTAALQSDPKNAVALEKRALAHERLGDATAARRDRSALAGYRVPDIKPLPAYKP